MTDETDLTLDDLKAMMAKGEPVEVSQPRCPLCKNCGRTIRWTTRGDRPHWTHSGGWQGRRCPGRLTGAEPAEQAEGLGPR